MGTSHCSLWSPSSAGYREEQGERGREGHRRKESALVLPSFLRFAALEAKGQKILFVTSQPAQILPWDFPRAQFPVVAPAGRGKQKVQSAPPGQPRVQGAGQQCLQWPQGFSSPLPPPSQPSPRALWLPAIVWALHLRSTTCCNLILLSIPPEALACFLSKNPLRPWCCPSSCFFLRFTINSFLTRTSPCSSYCLSITSPSRFM